MPINIPAKLPAAEILTVEGIFVMTDERASSQDIRPLKICILNIMPTKIVTETQLLRLLGNSPIQVEIVLLRPCGHESRNTSETHLEQFYKTFDEVRSERFDGMIITGAPVELMDFDEVDYWSELVEIMEWTKTNVYSTLHICWGAQAALYYHYGIEKIELKQKMFGVFEHYLENNSFQLTRGFDEVFYAPHSRHTGIDEAAVEANPKLEIVSRSDDAGIYIIYAKKGRQIFVTGHSEYDVDTLKKEYDRDVGRGLPINVPYNYYPDDDPSRTPVVRWRSHANLLFSNWLNYYVYQDTPFDLGQLVKAE